MDLWQITIFSKVVELKSFSKAGSSVRLSQPTVSSHIKDLEDYFGCRLIDRMGREAVPTKAGELLYRYARKLLALRDEAETAMAEFQGRIKGKLVIGGSTIPGGYLLPGIIGGFSADYPEVTVSLIVADTETVLAQIASERLELGIVGAETSNPRLEQIAVAADELCLIVPATHRWSDRGAICLDMLKTEPYILREQGSGTRKSTEKMLSEKGFTIRDLNVAAEMGSTVAVIQAIKSGLGVSILSTTAVREDIRNGRLKAVKIEGFDLIRRLYLTWKKNRSLSPLAEKFDAFIRQAMLGESAPNS